MSKKEPPPEHVRFRCVVCGELIRGIGLCGVNCPIFAMTCVYVVWLDAVDYIGPFVLSTPETNNTPGVYKTKEDAEQAAFEFTARNPKYIGHVWVKSLRVEDAHRDKLTKWASP